MKGVQTTNSSPNYIISALKSTKEFGLTCFFSSCPDQDIDASSVRLNIQLELVDCGPVSLIVGHKIMTGNCYLCPPISLSLVSWCLELSSRLPEVKTCLSEMMMMIVMMMMNMVRTCLM